MNGSCKSFVLFLIISLVTTLQLPAPIVEENPTPAPQQSAKAKPKPKAPAAKHTPSPAEKKSASPFAGTWEGAATVTCSNGETSNWPSIMVVFSANAGIVQTRCITGTGQIFGPFATAYAVRGGIPRWNFTSVSRDRQTSDVDSMSMRMLDSRAATVSVHRLYASGDFKGTSCDVTGTLIRQ